jgi:hypothetical protein
LFKKVKLFQTTKILNLVARARISNSIGKGTWASNAARPHLLCKNLINTYKETLKKQQ